MRKKKKFNFDLKICNESLLDVTVPFKRIDVLINGFQYYDTNTQKQDREKLRQQLLKKRNPPNKCFYTDSRLLIFNGSVAIFLESNSKVSYIAVDQQTALLH